MVTKCWEKSDIPLRRPSPNNLDGGGMCNLTLYVLLFDGLGYAVYMRVGKCGFL